MDLITIIGISIGLAMDALAVSVTNGFIIKDLKFGQAFRIAFFFGFFQAIMPIIGWAAGITFEKYIHAFDHWIAFALLFYIGGKMILESRKKNVDLSCVNCSRYPTLLMLSIATSIDALAVGLSFALLQVEIIKPVLIIGLITFIICIGGIYLGNRTGKLLGKKFELAGGIILIIIGIRIVIEHIILDI